MYNAEQTISMGRTEQAVYDLNKVMLMPLWTMLNTADVLKVWML